MKKILFLVALLLSLLCSGTLSAMNDSCLQIVGNGLEGYSNPDKVKIDTCVKSTTFERWYARKTYIFFADIYIFQEKPIKLGKSYTWQDLDTNLPTIRNAFHQLETTFGPYSFKRYNGNMNDSEHLDTRGFLIEFENYVLVDSVNYTVFFIDSVSSCNLLNPPNLLFVREINTDVLKIEVNQVENLLSIYFKENLTTYLTNLKIYDIYGLCLHESITWDKTKTLDIDISILNNGVYFLLVNNKIYKFLILR